MKAVLRIEKPGHPPIVLDVQRMRDEVVALMASVQGIPVAMAIADHLAEALGLDPYGKFDDPDDDPDEFADEGTGWPDRERAAQEPGGPDDDPDEFVAKRTAELSGMRNEWESRQSRK